MSTGGECDALRRPEEWTIPLGELFAEAGALNIEAGTAQPGPAARSALWLPLFERKLSTRPSAPVWQPRPRRRGLAWVFRADQLRWEAPVRRVADSWITLAAIVVATERLRLGPMVTPLPRRRPVKVARETATLDQLSGGRLTLGVGIGEDRFAREFSKTGEQLNERARGQMLDEALEILTTAWSGEPVHHHGNHYTVDDIQFLPWPGAATRRPGVGRWLSRQHQADSASRPLRRLLPCQPRASRPARRGRRQDQSVPTGSDGSVRLRTSARYWSRCCSTRFRVTVVDNFMFGQDQPGRCVPSPVLRSWSAATPRRRDDAAAPARRRRGDPARGAGRRAALRARHGRRDDHQSRRHSPCWRRHSAAASVMPTTNSGYGIGERDSICTEETPLDPSPSTARRRSRPSGACSTAVTASRCASRLCSACRRACASTSW